MVMPDKRLLREAAQLPAPDPDAAAAYRRTAAKLAALAGSLRDVQSAPTNDAQPQAPGDVDHEHALFMQDLFELGDLRLLVPAVPWAYRASAVRGVPDEENRRALDCWIESARRLLEPAHAAAVCEVYSWLRDHHDDWVQLAATDHSPGLSEAPPTTAATRAALLDLLVVGDQSGVVDLTHEIATDAAGARALYTDVIPPVMREIGRRWETGAMSVAEEHRASAIIARAVDACYPVFAPIAHTKGTALITAAPGERHSLGGRMVADLLEIGGWDVTYTGADTPARDVVQLASMTRPDVVGISVAMAGNLPRVALLARALRELRHFSDSLLLVGGWMTVADPGIWPLLGADTSATDAGSAYDVVTAWWKEHREGDPA